jgi:2-dehydro-3-deoxyphosphogluconate aldolase / (4S)-4-hydroxy-2-oxoglutarate aldolase
MLASMHGAPAVERIRSERLVAVLRRVSDVEETVDAVVAGGIRVVEVTLDSAGALAALERLRRRDGLTVLAGTVMSAEQAEAAARAGAEACVSPTLGSAVVERCRELGIPAIPGALTPSELAAAAGLGVPLVKLFPAGLGGPSYVREVLAPLSGLSLLVTGGVDASNARAFLDAGAAAVGVGSALTSAEDVEAEARRLVEAVHS